MFSTRDRLRHLTGSGAARRLATVLGCLTVGESVALSEKYRRARTSSVLKRAELDDARRRGRAVKWGLRLVQALLLSTLAYSWWMWTQGDDVPRSVEVASVSVAVTGFVLFIVRVRDRRKERVLELESSALDDVLERIPPGA
jgi:hypothetical protein